MGHVTDADIREKVTFLFQSDVLPPAQYFEKNKKKASLECENLLSGIALGPGS